MDSSTDLRLAELLASRLCHDLVGPISAISNGMELLEEGLSDLDEEARRLVGDSAAQAAASLQFFRMAFGFSAAPADDPGQLKDLVEAYLASQKASLAWSPDTAQPLPAGWGKLLLNMVALALEALPMGGRLQIDVGTVGGRRQLRCLARGTDAGLRPEVAAALSAEADPDQLTPRSVQGYYLARVARRLRAALSAEEEPDGSFLVSAVLPA